MINQYMGVAPSTFQVVYLLGNLHLPPLLGFQPRKLNLIAPSFCEEIVIGRVARATKRVKVIVAAGGSRRESGRFVSLIIRLPQITLVLQNQTLQIYMYIYGNFEEFSVFFLHCLGW